MITSVTFDDTIPYRVDRRASRFEASEGWSITEESPGRVRLRVDFIDVVVQSMPYTLEYAPTPTARPLTEDERVDFDAIIGPRAGNNAQLQQQQQQKRRGRP